jgi:hypothetical protein
MVLEIPTEMEMETELVRAAMALEQHQQRAVMVAAAAKKVFLIRLRPEASGQTNVRLDGCRARSANEKRAMTFAPEPLERTSRRQASAILHVGKSPMRLRRARIPEIPIGATALKLRKATNG